jgi:hypothetical protein
MKPQLTLHQLAADIHHATGHTGKHLEAATFLAAAMLAGVKGNRDAADRLLAQARAAQRPAEKRP